MKSAIPKVLHTVNGKPILAHVMDSVRQAGIQKLLVVAGHQESLLRAFVGSNVSMVRQMPQLGTAHAVLAAKKFIEKQNGPVLILPGDAPCVKSSTIRDMVRSHELNQAGATILTAEVEQPTGYGRILRRGNSVIGIREELDANPEEKKISEINSGIYIFESKQLLEHLKRIKANQKKKEYYLTDVVESFTEAGLIVNGFKAGSADEVLGINSRTDLAVAQKIMNGREIKKHQDGGVTIVSPENTYIAGNVTIGPDTIIYPGSWIEQDVRIGKKCQIGPLAVIRKGSVVGDGATIGCFVEIVRSKIGKDAKVKHLSYIGDADLGEKVNIGAGTVTANFDGMKKNKTTIRHGALIGSNTVLVAPVEIGKNARTGAGTVVLSRSKVGAGKTVVGVPAKIVGLKQKKK